MATKSDTRTTRDKLTSLTKGQRKLAAQVRDEWIPLATSTERADREAAEKGVRILYEDAWFDPPKITWVGSPAVGFRKNERGLAPELTGWRGTIGDPERRDTSARRDIDDALEAAVDDELIELSFDLIGDRVDAAFIETVEKPIVTAAKLVVPVKAWARSHSHWIPICKWETIGAPSLGIALAPTAGWVATMEFWQRAGVLSYDAITGYSLLKRSTAWWWPEYDRALLLERPVELKADSDGLLHSTRGKAITYETGWGLHFEHGRPLDDPTRKSWRYPSEGTVSRKTVRVSPVGGIQI